MGPLLNEEELLAGLSGALCPTAPTGNMEKWHEVGWDTQTQPAAGKVKKELALKAALAGHGS